MVVRRKQKIITWILFSSVVDDFNEMEEIKKPTQPKPVELLKQQGPGEKIEKKAH